MFKALQKAIDKHKNLFNENYSFKFYVDDYKLGVLSLRSECTHPEFDSDIYYGSNEFIVEVNQTPNLEKILKKTSQTLSLKIISYKKVLKFKAIFLGYGINPSIRKCEDNEYYASTVDLTFKVLRQFKR